MPIVKQALVEVSGPQTHTPYNKAMTSANTEYSQALPANTTRFTIRLQDNSAFRLAFATGKVATPTAPYFNCPAGTIWAEEGLDPRGTYTLYFASASNTKVAEISSWQEA